MANRNYEYQSDFAKKYFGLGKAEGQAQGEARALLHVLKAREIEVSEELRARILACQDLALLETWLARAATAQSAADVVGE